MELENLDTTFERKNINLPIVRRDAKWVEYRACRINRNRGSINLEAESASGSRL